MVEIIHFLIRKPSGFARAALQTPLLLINKAHPADDCTCYLCTCILVYLGTCVLVYLCTCALVYLCFVYLCTLIFYALQRFSKVHLGSLRFTWVHMGSPGLTKLD